MANFQNFDFSFEEFLNDESLVRLDKQFCDYLPETLRNRLFNLRKCGGSRREISATILALAPYLEAFVCLKFHVSTKTIADKVKAQSIISIAKKDFVRRIVLHSEVSGEFLWDEVHKITGNPLEEVKVAQCMIEALNFNDHIQVDLLIRFAKWALANPENEHTQSWALFSLPQGAPILFEQKPEDTYKDEKACARDGFEHWKSRGSESQTLDQSFYCLYCHHRDKDYCSTGHPHIAESKYHSHGCPLGQKISEMNQLYSDGFVIGALATIIVDNPMVLVTGDRICNDCRVHCIFQNQEPVHVPKLETHILKTVLDLPFGFEIYYLFIRWNPLNFLNPLPHGESEKNILVVGQGPAGFSLAHYLLNSGHNVVAIDGQTCASVESQFLDKPIEKVEWDSLAKRKSRGFGGVSEYGITVRWQKDFLFLVQISLIRRKRYVFFDGIKWGAQIKDVDLEKLGIDHVAFCTGIGAPHLPQIPNHLAGGVRTASDFLMHLHLTSAHLSESFSHLQIQLPLMVVGGGLTALDAATEALSYYPHQVKKVYKIFKELQPNQQKQLLDSAEGEKLSAFCSHAQEIIDFESQGKPILPLLRSWGGVKILYHKDIEKSPAYKTSSEEIRDALSVGVEFCNNRSIVSIDADDSGCISQVIVSFRDKRERHSVKTLLFATGFEHKKIPENLYQNILFSDSQKSFSISYVGDCNPYFQGSVVRALKSAKEASVLISEDLRRKQTQSKPKHVKKICADFLSSVVSQKIVFGDSVLLKIRSPSGVQKYKAGQYYRLQDPGSEPYILFPVAINKASQEISFILDKFNPRTKNFESHNAGDRVSLMGPVGKALEKNEISIHVSCQNSFLLQTLCILTFLQSEDVRIFCDMSALPHHKKDLIHKLYPDFESMIVSEVAVTSSMKFSANQELVLAPLQCAMGGVCGRCLIDVSTESENEQKSIFACRNLWHNPNCIKQEALVARKDYYIWNEIWKFKS